MEQWRRELYHSELYHYGVKGMKWGKHLFGLTDRLDDLYKKKISGQYYKDEARRHIDTMKRAVPVSERQARLNRLQKNAVRTRHLGSDAWRQKRSYGYLDTRPRVYTQDTNSRIRAAKVQLESSKKARDYHFGEAKRLMNDYHEKSLKGIAESKVNKAKSWLRDNFITEETTIRDLNGKTIKKTSKSSLRLNKHVTATFDEPKITKPSESKKRSYPDTIQVNKHVTATFEEPKIKKPKRRR